METKTPPWVGLAAGAFAGLSQDVLLHPLDTLRTRLNAAPTSTSVLKPITSSNPLIAFTSTGAQLFRTQGVLGFYRGFNAVLLFSIPTNALYLGGYTYWRERLESVILSGSGGGGEGRKEPTMVQRGAIDMAAGTCAELGACLLWTPYDVVRQRMQIGHATTPLQSSPSRSLFGGGQEQLYTVIRSVYAAQGLHGFYAGLSATILVYAPYSAIFFSTYEALKATWRVNTATSKGEVDGIELCCGMCAGAIAAAITQPLDCVKTRIQTASVEAVELRIAPVDPSNRSIRKDSVEMKRTLPQTGTTPTTVTSV